MELDSQTFNQKTCSGSLRTDYTSLPMHTRLTRHRILLPALLMFTLTPLLPHAASAVFAQTTDACPNDAAAFAKIQQRANQEDPSAQTALAFCYDLGRNVEPSRKENMRWLEQAANHNYAPAQYELGRIYLYGRGVPADYAKALLWERKAAKQGDARAQRDLALMYERGFGVTADPAQAAEWNRKAAAQGHAEAQFHLGQALAEGTGVKKDPAAARQWYAKAARQENPAAQLQLARTYAGNANCAQAIHWYKEAAAGGESEAMYELG